MFGVAVRLTSGPATVRLNVVVPVKLPDVPVTVTVTVPAAAVALAVSVSVLVVAVGFGLNFAVTPLGRPDAARLTLPLNPPRSVTVIVLVPLLPCTTVRAFGAAERMKPGVCAPAKALIRPTPLGLPQPVAKSNPVTAGKPLLPLTMSWNAAP